MGRTQDRNFLIDAQNFGHLGLERRVPPFQVVPHSHGKVHVAGGVFVFLCTNLGNGPAGTPACPATGTVSGTITADSIVTVTGQNIRLETSRRFSML